MTNSVSARAPVTRPGTPRVRHGFLAAALLVVAGLHVLSGDWVWAALIGLGGLAELGVLLQGRRRAAATPGTGDHGTAVRPDNETLSRSERAHRQAHRMWSWVVGVTLAAGLALIATSPSIAAVLGVLVLVALVKLRRERRSVQRLQALRTHTRDQPLAEVS